MIVVENFIGDELELDNDFGEKEIYRITDIYEDVVWLKSNWSGRTIWLARSYVEEEIARQYSYSD